MTTKLQEKLEQKVQNKGIFIQFQSKAFLAAEIWSDPNSFMRF